MRQMRNTAGDISDIRNKLSSRSELAAVALTTSCHQKRESVTVLSISIWESFMILIRDVKARVVDSAFDLLVACYG